MYLEVPDVQRKRHLEELATYVTNRLTEQSSSDDSSYPDVVNQVMLLLGSNHFFIYVPLDIRTMNLVTNTSFTPETSDA